MHAASICIGSLVFVAIFAGTARADLYTFKDGEEKTARLREYDPPIMRLEYADDTGTDFPVTTHTEFDYNVGTTKHPQKFVSEYYREANTLFEKGNTFYFRKDYRNAVLAYDQALAMNPQHMYAQLNKGSALLELSEYDEAIRVYEVLRRQEPSMGMPLAYIAYAYFLKQEYVQVRVIAKQAEALPDVAADHALMAGLERIRTFSDKKLFPL